MKKLLLSIALLLGATLGAQAQCVGVTGVSTAPVPGITCAVEPTVPSYRAAGFGIVPVASATDIACITGSATKIVRVHEMSIGGTAGTLVSLPVRVMKHSVANTGGTAALTTALPVPVALDSAFSAATATTTAYTANPTIDATAVNIDVGNVSFNTTAALVAIPTLRFSWKDRTAAAPTLRGVAQQLCMNLGGISVASGLLAVSMYWTEQNQ